MSEHEMRANLLPSERWWQEHGGEEWCAEITRRRHERPLYHLQEMFLSRYFRAFGRPARVLEFGCGFGRHLDYLRRNRKLELYGCDQSERMLHTARELLGDESWAGRLALTSPRQPLPYPDKWFDVSYTVSVLLHVPPEALEAALSELVRVTRHSILHIESNVSAEERLLTEVHDGCWSHNLSYAYHKAGATCVVLPKHFLEEDIYRATVMADPALEPEVSGEDAAHSLQLDRWITEGFRLRDEAYGDLRFHHDDLAARFDEYRRQVRGIVDSASE